MCDMFAGDGENGFAFGISGDLDNCLAHIDDLARSALVAVTMPASRQHGFRPVFDLRDGRGSSADCTWA